MSKTEYIEKYGYISNSQYKQAQFISKTYGIEIQDWKLPVYQLLNQKNIDLMIQARLHIKYNCIQRFKNNFYRMDVLPYNKGIYIVNYTGHVIKYNGTQFYGDYKFCIHKIKNPINVTDEKLYFIDGSYPIYSVTSCLKDDTQRVKDTNPNWWKEETLPIEIKPYNILK